MLLLLLMMMIMMMIMKVTLVMLLLLCVPVCLRSMQRWAKANILSRVRFWSGAAYQCKRHAASCINKFKANIDQGEFPERSKHHVAYCVNRFRVQ